MTTRTKTKARTAVKKPAGRTGKVVLYALIDGEQHRALHVLGFMRQVPIADLVRTAIDEYLAAKGPTAADIDAMVKLIRKSVRRMDRTGSTRLTAP